MPMMVMLDESISAKDFLTAAGANMKGKRGKAS
jgi:hypothetical protein